MPEASLQKDYWHTVKDVNLFYILFFYLQEILRNIVLQIL